MPSVYNKKRYVQHNHNCFAYAFDIMDVPSHEECNGADKEDCKVPFHQPGKYSGQGDFHAEKRCFDLFTRLKADMPAIEIARAGQPIKFTDKCPKGYSKIALVVDPKQDYHFYRQDSNGFWSHKPGATAVTNKDTSGRLIYNPELANRDARKTADEKDGLNYNVFCGFMCVPRVVPNRAKRGGSRRRKTCRLIGGMENNTGYAGNTNSKKAPAKTHKVRVGKSRFGKKVTMKKPSTSNTSWTSKANTEPVNKLQHLAILTMIRLVNSLKDEFPVLKENEDFLKDYAKQRAKYYKLNGSAKYRALYGQDRQLRKFITDSFTTTDSAKLRPEFEKAGFLMKKSNPMTRGKKLLSVRKTRTRPALPAVTSRPVNTTAVSKRAERAEARAAKRRLLSPLLPQRASPDKHGQVATLQA